MYMFYCTCTCIGHTCTCNYALMLLFYACSVADGDMFGAISTLKTLPADDDMDTIPLVNGIKQEEEEEEIYVDEDEPLEDDDEDEDDDNHIDRRRY